MAKEAFARILEAENNAKELIANAKEEAKRILKSVKETIDNDRQQRLSEIKQQDVLKSEDMRKEIQKEIDAILQASTIECEKISDIDKEKKEKAKNFLRERIIE